jgi:serine phosphatase RsbU (regulator of sigma subunit)/CRP-like cAMP-binding protein
LSSFFKEKPRRYAEALACTIIKDHYKPFSGHRQIAPLLKPLTTGRKAGIIGYIMPVNASRLRRFPFLRSLDQADVESLAERVEEHHYFPRELIFPDGQVGDKFYLLSSGRVQIVKPTPDGEVELNEMRPGDSFGEMSLLDGEPRSAAARAAGEVSVLEMPKDVFLSLIRQFPALLYLTALENAQRLRRSDIELIAELQARNQELSQLYEISLDISRHLELDLVLAAITKRAQGLLDSAGSALHLYDPLKELLVAASPHKHVRPGEGPTGQAFSSGTAVYANPTPQSKGKGRKRGMLRCELAAPISLEKKKLGALTVFRPLGASPFNKDDAQLLHLLANQAAIAIENARLFGVSVDKGRLDGELRAARQVQRSLIPTRPPRVPGFQLTGLWRPAREVAGDFYDFIPMGRDKWGIAIGDVSDKGAAAALFMAISRSILRASVVVEPEAAHAIEHANRVLSADSTRGMFVTLFFAILETRTRRVTYVNAGHNPPIVLRAASHRLERLGQHGLALGVDPDLQWKSHELELEDKDLVVLYTDGVTEAFNARDQIFGERRLARIVTASSDENSSGVVRAIDHGVRKFIGPLPLADDITVVVLKASA